MPDVAVEGVEYAAAVAGNMGAQGADAGGIKNATDLYKSAAQKCPKSVLLGGGYSQGAALQHRAIEALPKSVQDRIAGVVLYGDTKNQQDGARLKQLLAGRVTIYCNDDDGVCKGGLNVNKGHMSYNTATHFVPGAQFYKSRAEDMLKKIGA
jgi:cutinase